MTTDTKEEPAVSQVLDGYVTTPELAKQLGVRPETVGTWIAQVDGLPYVKLGRSYFFKVADVRAWIEGRTRRRNQTKA